MRAKQTRKGTIVSIIYGAGALIGAILMLISNIAGYGESLVMTGAIIMCLSVIPQAFTKKENFKHKKEMEVLLNDERHIEIVKLSTQEAYKVFSKISIVLFPILLILWWFDILHWNFINKDFIMGFMLSLSFSVLCMEFIKIYYVVKYTKKIS